MIPSRIDGHIIHHMIVVNQSNMSSCQYHFIHGIEKRQLVRKCIYINEHERLSTITIRHRFSKDTACRKKGYGFK
jgi:hypothetical protein